MTHLITEKKENFFLMPISLNYAAEFYSTLIVTDYCSSEPKLTASKVAAFSMA